jgi:hypothetical protein
MKAESAGTWRDESSDNLFSLSAETHAWLDDAGLCAQWIPETVYGMPYESLVPSGDMRKFWTPVQADDDIPGLDNPERGGCRLFVRPVQMQKKIDEHHQREAASRLRDHEEAMLHGDLRNVTLDAGHASARASNKVRHGYERISVVGDE